MPTHPFRDQLQEFAGRFVIATFRERFVHEALKDQTKLHTRICHQIQQVFPTRYAKGSVPFAPGDRVIPIVGTNQTTLVECTWDEIAPLFGSGMGMLITSADLLHFYAETESEAGSPFLSYSHRSRS